MSDYPPEPPRFDPHAPASSGPGGWGSPDTNLPPAPPSAGDWSASAPAYGWTPPPGGWTPPYGNRPYDPAPSFASPTPPPAAPVPAAPTRQHHVLAFLGGLLAATVLILAAVLVKSGFQTTLNTGSAANQTPTAQSPTQSPSSPFGGSGQSNQPSQGSSNNSAGPSSSEVSGAAAKVTPGVVDIDTKLGYQEAAAAGTGMVITSNGDVLTNNHVIDGATSITATLVNTGKTYTATVVGTDVTADVAVIHLQGASNLTTVPIGDSSTVASGDSVIAIGNAGGKGGTPSIVSGTITDLNQSIRASDENGGNSEMLTDLLETDAAIVAGDSGGPMINTKGQVIGIDTAASSSNQYMSQNSTGYAIPINKAIGLAKQIQQGKASATIHIGPNAFLGVQILPADSSQSGGSGTFGGNGFGGGLGNGNSNGSNGSSSTSSSGAQIAGVVAGSPADKAGLAQGDTITSFDGSSVTTPDSLTALTQKHHPGDRVTVGWTDSSGDHHSATITLATGPAA
jgi:S1-C subfamily serine protease